jgi:hypothetical protein
MSLRGRKSRAKYITKHPLLPLSCNPPFSLPAVYNSSDRTSASVLGAIPPTSDCLRASSSVLPHSITISLSTAHVVFEGFGDLQHTLDVLHTEDGFLGECDGLRCLDRVLDLSDFVSSCTNSVCARVASRGKKGGKERKGKIYIPAAHSYSSYSAHQSPPR